MARLIINCDLGENESTESTRELMALVDAANIGCGTHAGSLEKTRESLEMAKASGVMVGAHPGLAARGGRNAVLPSLSEFISLLEAQVTVFLSMAEGIGVTVRYIKLHGTLYHAVEQAADLAHVYCDFVRCMQPELGIFALAGGTCAQQAQSMGIPVWEEMFADRGYLASGALVPRGDVGALLDAEEASDRYVDWLKEGHVRTVDGGLIALSADTICVHSDSSGALQLLRSLRAQY